MIELRHDTLQISFPEVHPAAKLRITFMRTLRIPDNDREYPLPPGLGTFPLRHVDDFAAKVPEAWDTHGGVLLPMYQAEAMWLSFDADWVEDHDAEYPFAVKIAAGKVNAVTGASWSNALHRRPQDYLVSPTQPWLDGYCVERGVIRQFVAMPLGQGFTAEEQLTGEAEHGGLQIVAYPMKRKIFEKRFPKVRRRRRERAMEAEMFTMEALACPSPDMGLAPGGKMRQEIYDDPYRLSDWDPDARSRCFVHLANSEAWRDITGEAPPVTPVTAEAYMDAGLPWFEYYDEGATAVEGGAPLKGLKSVAELGGDEVREGEF